MFAHQPMYLTEACLKQFYDFVSEFLFGGMRGSSKFQNSFGDGYIRGTHHNEK